MRVFPVLMALGLCGCGGTSPVAPTVPQPTPLASSPTPAPAAAPPVTITIQGTLTDTLSKAVIGNFTRDVPSLPATVTVSAPGHIERTTRVGSASATVDLIPTAAPFSSIFYGQLVRNMFESSTPDVVWVLPAAPSLYLQTTGLSSPNIDHLVAAARDVVPMMTGKRYSLAALETGADTRPERPGWIVVDVVNEGSNNICGRAQIGAISGHIWLNVGEPGCEVRGDRIPAITFRHEIGHALGFFHIDVPNSLMYHSLNRGDGLPTELEKYHAAIAYTRSRGNRDPDVDAPTSAPLRQADPRLVID